MERLPEGEVGVISQDSYYKDSSHVPPEERQNINFDEPAAFDWNLLLEHVKQLKKGEPIEMPTYSYLTCSRQKETEHMDPHDVVLIEGIMALVDSRLRKMMDIKVFVDADGDDRLIRVISRDCIERGRTAEAVIERYQRVLKPMHQLHIEPTKKFANIIIPEGGNNEVAINLITDYIKGRLTTNKKK
jgi:uridine kinase